MPHLEGALGRLRLGPLRRLVQELLPTDEAAAQDSQQLQLLSNGRYENLKVQRGPLRNISFSLLVAS